jgi:hypothetical protein
MAANYVLLEKITVGATKAASITFNNIPQTGYTDLKLVMSTRLDSASGANFNYVKFNGSSTGFTIRTLEGSGNGAGSGSGSTGNAGLDEGTSYTANTFSSTDIYIPNYTSSNYKSYSVETVTENNATAAYMEMVAGLWSNTAAITSVTVYPDTGGRNYVQYSTFALYGLAAVGATPAIDPKATGGDIIQTDGTYWYHAFLSSGTFTPKAGLTCDYLVIAGGGGGGGGWEGAGGGAGGLRSTVTATGGGGTLEPAISLNSGTAYTVTIGAGGAGGASGNNLHGTQGSNSVFSTITSIGGGYGASGANLENGGSGGSGGGTGRQGTGGTGTSGQGYAGGYNTTFTPTGAYATGGGGGAGQVGGNSSADSSAGAGGAGVSIPSFASATSTGVSNYYAGGGGGAAYTGSTNGAGGAGGGGAGNYSTPTTGTANTGGGGGGARIDTGAGAAGGSGLVIIRYSRT